MKRLDSLQVYRGIAAILILLYHLSDYSRKTLDFTLLGNAFAFDYGSVDFFLVLTGFTLLYSHGADIGRHDRFFPFLLNRFIRVYPFYWVISLTKIAAMVLIPSYGKSYEKELLYIVKSLLLLPQDNLPIIGAAWILSYIVLFYIVFGFVIVVGSRWAVVLLTGWAISIIGLAAAKTLPLCSLPSNGLLDFALYPRNIEFIVGCVCAVVIKNQWLKYPWLAFFAGLSLLALGRLYTFVVSGASLETLVLVVGFSSFLLIIGSAILEQTNQIRFPSFLVFLGNASYSIYLGGFAVVNLCAMLLLRPPFSTLVSPTLPILVIAVLAILGACILYLSIERPLLAFLKRRVVSQRNQLAVSTSLVRGAQ